MSTGFSLFKKIEAFDHEEVVFCHDPSTNLKAIISVHNTVLGPALGGTRMWNYESEEEAIEDVLRLSRGMTYKAAISGLNLGGGKAVIIGKAEEKSEAMLRRFGKFVDSLGGKYVTAEDMNMSTEDMEYISMETKHVTGLHESIGGGGDPGPVTAYGTYMGMKAAVKKATGTASLENLKVAVQGTGSVGSHLLEYLTKEKAIVFISDIYPDKVNAIGEKYNATIVPPSEIYDLDVDVYAPCAMGATINDDTINRLKCKVIAGAANNQLKDENIHGQKLMESGIIYAPDFLINAGGLINVGIDYLGGYSKEIVFRKTEKIYDTCTTILDISEKESIPTHKAAMKLAQKRIDEIAAIKTMR